MGEPAWRQRRRAKCFREEEIITAIVLVELLASFLFGGAG